ncbi:hypothetical protein J7384_00550 [Endozoicomonas sp. G2_1]|uniref:hypothetical protein n=1 Tax=Endozoicomonas sp. G2_1 TaxID=2821091 RepID=UPI001AD9AA81|nr:hypothetical protein [Endozoicomonas sp. G2_1]MBO9488844.1 hypothetical protein [Endozoicomonas sp. G2_1]
MMMRSLRFVPLPTVASAVLAAALIFSALSIAVVGNSIAAEGDSEATAGDKVAVDKDAVATKYYQRALFYYFQQQPELALRQLEYNETRLAELAQQDDGTYNNALLFKAGLQVHLGLHLDAERNLKTLISRLSSHASASDINSDGQLSNQQANKKQHTPEQLAEVRLKQQTLLMVALLQLAEQQINQGAQQLAQQTLARISFTSDYDEYYGQYYTLMQLAYWPQSVPEQALLSMPAPFSKALNAALDKDSSAGLDISSIDSISSNKSTSHNNINQQLAYILVNRALSTIESLSVDNDSKASSQAQAAQFTQITQAKQDLQRVKTLTWQRTEQSFWQRLFQSENDDSATAKATGNNREVTQSLKDYASLLLAQLYVKQQDFDLAYQELAQFPEHSPYRQQAMFLFALSALKVEDYDSAQAIFHLLVEQYPNSYLAWQSSGLLAKQFALQNQLEQAYQHYQVIEADYQRQLTDITGLSGQLKQVVEQLQRQAQGQSLNKILREPAILARFSAGEKTWLEQALLEINQRGWQGHQHDLRQLTDDITELDSKQQWLGNSLALNQSRLTKIKQQYQQVDFQQQIEQLSEVKDDLTASLEIARHQQLSPRSAQRFANQQEQTWLDRIEASNKVLSMMKNFKDYQSRVQSYQERLERVSGVLNWRLQQQFPDRLWRQEYQVQQLSKIITDVEQQADRVSELQQRSQQNPLLEQRYLNIVGQQRTLSARAQQLNQVMSQDFEQQLAGFIEQKQQQLNYYLHHSRRSMANVLERLTAQTDSDSASTLSTTKDFNAKGSVVDKAPILAAGHE